MLLGFTVAERVLYIPSVGFCVLLAVILEKYIDSFEITPAPESDTKTKDVKPKQPARKRTSKANVWIALAVLLIALYCSRFGV